MTDLSQQPLDLSHNPILSREEIQEMTRHRCTYFQRTGVCKYGNLCNKVHVADYRGPLRTLIFPAMYTNMLLGYEILQNTDSGFKIKYK